MRVDITYLGTYLHARMMSGTDVFRTCLIINVEVHNLT